MSNTAHKLFYEYQLLLLVMFACIISFSRVYADNHVKIVKPTVPVNPTAEVFAELVTVTTPLLINLSESRARTTLAKKGLKLKVSSRRQLSTGRGLIISQQPKAGTRLRLGQAVSVIISIPVASKPLTVSISPPLQTVVQGSLAVFKATYNKKNVRLNWQMSGQSGISSRFTVNTKNLKPGSYVVNLLVTETPQINVLSNIQLTSKAKRTRARLIVKADVVQKSVPNIIKFSRNDAFEIIRKNRLILGKVTEKSTATKSLNDIVYNQRPLAGKKTTVGAKVDLWVYKLTLEPLRVKITQNKNVIEQGETITFTANSKTQPLRYNWSGADKTSTTNRLVINSSKLSPKTYFITLKVWDKNKRSSVDRAVFKVTKEKPRLITVPDVTQRYRTHALEFIHSKDFKLGKITYKTLSKGRNDWVLEQRPVKGTRVLANSKIDLIVSKHPPLPPLVVRIDPSNPIIEQNKEVSFVVESKNELTKYLWEGAGQKSSNKRFVIQSQNLAPKSYEIKLTVGDKHGRKVTARSTLQVIKPEVILIRVPDIIGLDHDDAIRRLQDKQLYAGTINYREITTEADGKVVEQTPKAGVEVKSDSKVDLWISKKKIVAVVIVPNLMGQDIGSADEILTAEGLVSGLITKKVISSGESQRVLEQTPKAMTQVKKGSRVNLIISSISTTPPIIENFTLGLNVENPRQFAGKATKFLLKPSKPDAGAQYWLQLDEEKSSEKFNQTRYKHIFKQSGIHRVYAKTRINGKVYQSEPVNIWILPAWLMSLAAGLGLLSLSVGAVKVASSSQVKVIKKIKPPKISVKPNTDLGYQKISRVTLVAGKDNNIDGQEYHSSVGFENTLNDGEWEVLIKENNKKIEGSYSDE